MQSLLPLFINCNYFHIAFKKYSYTIFFFFLKPAAGESGSVHEPVGQPRELGDQGGADTTPSGDAAAEATSYTILI